MIRTTPHRLHVERRLLAALFLWPHHICTINLARRDFQSPIHAALFDVISEAGEALQQDAQAIPLLIAAARKLRVIGQFKCVDGIEEYVMTRLVPMDVERREIPTLEAQVRECHHCGR